VIAPDLWGVTAKRKCPSKISLAKTKRKDIFYFNRNWIKMDITKLLRTLFFVVFFATIFAVIIKNFYTRIPKDVVGLYTFNRAGDISLFPLPPHPALFSLISPSRWWAKNNNNAGLT